MLLFPVTLSQAIEGYRKAKRMISDCTTKEDIRKVYIYILIVDDQLHSHGYIHDLFSLIDMKTSAIELKEKTCTQRNVHIVE